MTGVTMKRHIAVRFRAYPTGEQANLIERTIGCARLVYNLMLETRIRQYRLTGKSAPVTPARYKDKYPFLCEVDGYALCNAQLNLNRAYRNFFSDPKRVGFPRFKSKRHSRSSYTTNLSHGNIRLDTTLRRIRLPKVGWLAIRQHKTIPDHWKLKSVTVEHCRSGRYTATILFEYETQVPGQVEPVNIVGLDYASHGLYVSSDGEHAEYPGFFRRNETRLAREQRKLSHMVKGSNNWRKQKTRIARIAEKTAKQRRDFLHKTANRLVERYDAIGVEDIDMTVMARKPKPKPDPGHEGRYLPNGASSRSGLAKSTMDNAYGMFRTLLAYKLEKRGKRLAKVNKWYPSSQLCNRCGYRNKQTRDLSVRQWDCPECGAHHDRDINAAINLRNETARILAEQTA